MCYHLPNNTPFSCVTFFSLMFAKNKIKSRFFSILILLIRGNERRRRRRKKQANIRRHTHKRKYKHISQARNAHPPNPYLHQHINKILHISHPSSSARAWRRWSWSYKRYFARGCALASSRHLSISCPTTSRSTPILLMLRPRLQSRHQQRQPTPASSFRTMMYSHEKW